jgi:hypothetical protein
VPSSRNHAIAVCAGRTRRPKAHGDPNGSLPPGAGLDGGYTQRPCRC